MAPQNFTEVAKQILNQARLEFLQNIFWFKFSNCFGKTSQKDKFVNNVKFKTPNGVKPIELDSPSKCLTEEIDLSSKFILFLKWHAKC